MQDFRKLKVWQKGHAVTMSVYEKSTKFPRHELFGLTSQTRRSASSIPMNIAEGCGRGTDADFARFLQLAMGSASELEYQLLLSKDLGYLTQTDHAQLTQDVIELKRMLTSLIRRVRRQGSD